MPIHLDPDDPLQLVAMLTALITLGILLLIGSLMLSCLILCVRVPKVWRATQMTLWWMACHAAFALAWAFTLLGLVPEPIELLAMIGSAAGFAILTYGQMLPARAGRAAAVWFVQAALLLLLGVVVAMIDPWGFYGGW